MVQPGKYETKVADYGASETTTGKPYVYAYFNVDGGSVKWTGYLTEKAIEKTMEQLTYLGCKDFVSIAEGLTGGALDQNALVSVTVEHEADQKSGKVYAKVKWVNKIGGKKTQTADQVAQAKNTLAAYAGQFLAAQQKMGQPTSTKKTLGF